MKTVLYFNEELHKYTNQDGLTYTSMTTVISKYEDKFDANKMAKQCHQRYYNKAGHRYFNMTVKEIITQWDYLRDSACDRGNERHNYLEDVVKRSSGYTRNSGKFINDRIYTIDDILTDHKFGQIDISYFEEQGLKERYPSIYAIIKDLVDKGWRIYSEIGVFYNKLMISGLVDILFVKGDSFRILDWKTNKAKMHFESGYFKRDNDGRDTDHWISTDNRMKAPLAHIQQSHGNTYTLQLSGYAWLIEQFGLKCKGLLLCHIRPKQLDEYGNIPNDSNEKDDIIDYVHIEYLAKEAEVMFKHHWRIHVNKQTNLNLQ